MQTFFSLRGMCAGMLLASAAVWAPLAQAAKLETELQRFIQLYRPGEMASHMVAQVVKAGHQRGEISAARKDCLLEKLNPGLMNQAALIVARERFGNLARLQRINEFLESSTGRKMIDLTSQQFSTPGAQDFSKEYDAGNVMRQMSAKELEEIGAFEKLPEYADFSNYVNHGLQQINQNPQVQALIRDALKNCQP
ncbi:hypothetical protein V8J88_03400 [Massilia sp. W12]|uniref:hypothetical protein n=1 Tax=Massilia sp. W12 TaxID=3126507 RepID=UPI0030D18FBD